MPRTASVLPIALIAACGVALLGWFVYDRSTDGSALALQAASEAQLKTTGERNLALPSAPPMPYRFAGTTVQQGELQFLLERDDRVIAVTSGMILDRDYRVDTTSAREIALVYLPSGLRQTVPISQAPWPPPVGEGVASAKPAAPSPLPPAVQRTTSPALIELAR